MLEFYCDVLGCRLEKTQQKFGLYQLRAGANLIDLIDIDGELGRLGGAAPATEGRTLDHFCLRIEPFNIEQIRSHLAKHGIQPGEVADRYGAEGYGPSIYVTDPDGNVIELKGPPNPAL